jgi:Flp pilus assembly protein TadD
MQESGPLAEMNNMAVTLAADERYFEAEIILKQALEETDSEPALHNNLGVVYEMTGRAGPASLQYLRACILDDGNRRMRSNFLGLLEIPGK